MLSPPFRQLYMPADWYDQRLKLLKTNSLKPTVMSRTWRTLPFLRLSCQTTSTICAARVCVLAGVHYAKWKLYQHIRGRIDLCKLCNWITESATEQPAGSSLSATYKLGLYKQNALEAFFFVFFVTAVACDIQDDLCWVLNKLFAPILLSNK